MTATELIASTLHKAGIIGDYESPTAEQVSQHVKTLNDMMAQLEAEGIEVGYYAIESGNEDVYIPPFAMNMVKLGLLIAIQMDYDKPVTAEQAAQYVEARRVVIKFLVKPQPVKMQGAVPIGSVPFRFRFSGQ